MNHVLSALPERSKHLYHEFIERQSQEETPLRLTPARGGDNTIMSQSPTDMTEVYAETAGLSESEYHQLLGAERRRVALSVLMELNAPVDLEVMAATVAVREQDIDTADKETIRRVAVTLHHVHLPKMANVGVIEYDPDTTRVESCPSRLDS